MRIFGRPAAIPKQEKDDVSSCKRDSRPEERGISHSDPTPDEGKADDHYNNRCSVKM